jgi:ATP-dependent Clp protease protease subunit
MSDDNDSGNDVLDLTRAAEKNIVTVYVNDFTESSYKEFRSNVFKAEKSGQTVIPVIVDSYGGYVDALFAMVDVLQSVKLPVATIGTGKAMSCGSVLVSAGTKGYRYMSPLGRVMVHEVSSATWGKNSEIKASAKETERLNEVLLHLLDKHCEKPAGYWRSQLKENKNADLYLTAEQAKEHGLIDIIGTPRVTAEVKAKTKLVV